MSPAANSPVNPQSPLDRARGFLSPVNLHLAGIALLLLANVYLLAHLAIAFSGAYRDDAEALEQQSIELKGAEIAAQPLRGLDLKLARANVEAEKFYQQRIPAEDSTVIAELGDLAKKDGVKLTRVQYSEGGPANASAATKQDVGAAEAGLTEIRMDASLSGDYRPLVQFINGLERDKVFFLIGGVALTGQQSGVVNLRMKVDSYLRQPTAEERERGAAGKEGVISFDEKGNPQAEQPTAAAAPAASQNSGVRR